MAGAFVPARPSGTSDLDLVAVRALLAVVEHHHFGRAATSLRVSVSTVTKRIRRLESSIGVLLLQRDSGGVVGLTRAGVRFVQYAPELLHVARTAQVAAVGEVSTLRIGVPAGVQFVAPLMASELVGIELLMAVAHAGVGLVLRPTPFGSIEDDLFDRRIDVMLMVGDSADDRLVSSQLGNVSRVGVVGAAHPYAYRSSVDVHEFARQPMVRVTDLPAPYMEPFLLADVRPLNQAVLVPIKASGAAQVAQRLLRGTEVTVVPAAVTAQLPPGIKRVRLTGVPPLPYTAICRADDDRLELTTLISLLSDFMASLDLVAAH